MTSRRNSPIDINDPNLRAFLQDPDSAGRPAEWHTSGTAKVALQGLAAGYGLTVSDAAICERKLHTAHTKCSRACSGPPMPPRGDHFVHLRRSDGRMVLLIQPYVQFNEFSPLAWGISAQHRAELDEWCMAKGLAWMQPPWFSPHFPSSATPILIYAP